MNEWTECWIVVQKVGPYHSHWIKFSYSGPMTDHETGTVVQVTGKTQFTIHCARHLLKTQAKGWEIMHMSCNYGPEEWVGVPGHYVNKHAPRVHKHPGLSFIHPAGVPANHVHE